MKASDKKLTQNQVGSRILSGAIQGLRISVETLFDLLENEDVNSLRKEIPVKIQKAILAYGRYERSLGFIDDEINMGDRNSD